jgi:hypothetical protein
VPQNLKAKIEIMKTIKKVFLLMLLFASYLSSAQASGDEKTSLPIDPKTNCYVRYYYFPNLEAYFDNLELIYYYKVNGEWETGEELPAHYGGYSLYNKLKVSITDYDEDEPYTLLSKHKKMYPYNAKGRFANQTASSD